MTANRAEQKGGGSMGITAEQRAALEAAGWTLAERDRLREVWMHGEGCCIVPPTPTLHKAVEFAAILGLHPPGYVMVPVEVAREAELECRYAATKHLTDISVERAERVADSLAALKR